MLAAFLLNLVILAGILLGMGLAYVLLVGGLAWLVGRRWGAGPAWALWFTVLISVALVILAVPVFEGVASLLRHDPPGVGGLQRADWTAYAAAVQFAFYWLYAMLLLVSAAVGYGLGQRRAGRGKPIALGAVLTEGAFLLLTLPVVDFANACLIGRSFVLRVSC